MLSCSWWVPALQDVLVADGRSGRAAPRSEGLFFFFPPFYKKKIKICAVQIICFFPCADNLTAFLKALVSLKYARPIRILIFVQRPGA